jgi:hypothetical protein
MAISVVYPLPRHFFHAVPIGPRTARACQERGRTTDYCAVQRAFGKADSHHHPAQRSPKSSMRCTTGQKAELMARPLSTADAGVSRHDDPFVAKEFHRLESTGQLASRTY